jgi:hypothetical protein
MGLALVTADLKEIVRAQHLIDRRFMCERRQTFRKPAAKNSQGIHSNHAKPNPHIDSV